MNFKTALSEIVKEDATFTLFTAPMAWGKTRVIWSLLEEHPKIIFFCPLRSIVNELKNREHVYLLEGENKEVALKSFLTTNKGILVSTVESFPWKEIENVIENYNPLFVLDELHLFFIWGREFRVHLIDLYRLLILKKSRVLGLTATFPEEMIEELKEDLFRNDMKFYQVDLGNFRLKFEPQKQKELTYEVLKKLLYLKGKFTWKKRTLVFVKTRKEAYELFMELRSKGIPTNYCVGGEVIEFEKREENETKVIVSTSVLSHGVNIKNISNIFILYRPDESFLAQMIGRGGRFGEKFNTYLLKAGQPTALKSKIKEKIDWLKYASVYIVTQIFL